MKPVDKTYGPGSLDSAGQELTRLETQAASYRDSTRRFLSGAGVTTGMRVLDVGSGTGDISFIASELVGSSGQVVGIDLSPEAVGFASAKAAERSATNVRFSEANVLEWSGEGEFDAVIGRFFLMHFGSPSMALTQVSRRLKGGGLAAFLELDYSGVRFSEPLPLCTQCLQWISTALRKIGADPEMGLKLHKTFIESGFPQPRLSLEAAIGGGRGFPGYQLTIETIGTLLPVIERFGIATRDEIDLPTLKDRLDRELSERNGVVVLPAVIGAWSRKPV
jgi:ubiquinone/menaquinone biosynthesis C-methylase UbiE